MIAISTTKIENLQNMSGNLANVNSMTSLSANEVVMGFPMIYKVYEGLIKIKNFEDQKQKLETNEYDEAQHLQQMIDTVKYITNETFNSLQLKVIFEKQPELKLYLEAQGWIP
jgi:hypothetical protein